MNREYYRYLIPFLPILNILEFCDDKADFLTAVNLIYALAENSMNVPIYKLNSSDFQSKRNIQKNISNPEFSKKYLADIIFFNNLKEVSRKSIKVKDLIKKIQSITEININILENKKEILNHIKDYILNFYKDNSYGTNVKIILNKIGMKEVASNDLYLQQLPLSNNYKLNFETLLEENKFIEYIKTTKNNVLLILGDLVKNFNNILSKKGYQFMIGAKETLDICILFNNSIIKTSLLTKSNLKDLLSKDVIDFVVVNYKEIDYTDFLISGIHCNKRIYIYCDRTYNNAKDIIDIWNDRILKYIYFDYDGLIVLLIHIHDNVFFFLPMTPVVAAFADIDIIKNRKNMIMSIDSQIDNDLNSFQIIHEIDLIITSFFEIGMKERVLN